MQGEGSFYKTRAESHKERKLRGTDTSVKYKERWMSQGRFTRDLKGNRIITTSLEASTVESTL